MVKLVKKDKPVAKTIKTIKVKAMGKRNASVDTTILPVTKKMKKTHYLKVDEVTSAVSALLQVIEKTKDQGKKKSSLFKDQVKEIVLQVVPVKIPKECKMILRTVLPNSLAIESADVCLITENVKKSTKDDHEPTITYYKSLLQEQKIKHKIEIVPIRQLRSEHVSYEMKGRFGDLYDIYLIDGRLFGKTTKFLGSRFFKKRKHLIPVKINTNRFKHEVERGLSTTAMCVHGLGDSYTAKIGYSHFSTAQLVQNICTVAKVLANRFPGGFDNVRKLLITTHGTMAIPVYVSLAPADSVPVPVVKQHLPKAYKPVEGELTTIIGGQVTVLPTGEVFVKKVPTKEDVEMGFARAPTPEASDEELSESEAEEDEEGAGSEADEEVIEHEEPKTKDKKHKKRKDEDEESSDDDMETVENEYMQELQERQYQPASVKETSTNVSTEKKSGGNNKSTRKKGASSEIKASKKLETVENALTKKSPALRQKKPKAGTTRSTLTEPSDNGVTHIKKKKDLTRKKERTDNTAGRYFSPENAMDLLRDGVPVQEQKALIGKKQLKKSKLNLAMPETESTAKSPQKRKGSDATPKPKKLRGESALDLAGSSSGAVNVDLSGSISSQKLLKEKKKKKDKKVPVSEQLSDVGSFKKLPKKRSSNEKVLSVRDELAASASTKKTLKKKKVKDNKVPTNEELTGLGTSKKSPNKKKNVDERVSSISEELTVLGATKKLPKKKKNKDKVSVNGLLQGLGSSEKPLQPKKKTNKEKKLKKSSKTSILDQVGIADSHSQSTRYFSMKNKKT